MSLPPWSERIKDNGPPKKVDIRDFSADVPLGNNNPTDVQMRMYDTPGNTPLNKPQGALFELEGRYQDNSWRDHWFKGSNWNY